MIGHTLPDPRIGVLVRGPNKFVYYAAIDGGFPERSTPEEILALLNGDEAPQTPVANAAKPAVAFDTYDVVMRFQYPAWDEVDGIPYPGISARSKSEAIETARGYAQRDGHAIGGKGRYWFTATLSE